MNENPYAPPKAVVSDVAEDERQRTRPPQIALVVKLAAGAYALSLLAVMLTWSSFYSKLGSLSYVILNQVVSVAVLIWLYYNVWLGRNWARILILVFTVLGALTMLNGDVRSMLAAQPPAGMLVMLLNYGVSIVILWLLFVSPGRVWFQKADKENAG
jgi:hypothetical protein